MTNYLLHKSRFAGKTNCQARNEAASDEMLLFSRARFRAGSISKINMMDGEIYLETKSIGRGVVSSSHNIHGNRTPVLINTHIYVGEPRWRLLSSPALINTHIYVGGERLNRNLNRFNGFHAEQSCRATFLFCCQTFASGFFEGKPRGELNQTQTTSTK